MTAKERREMQFWKLGLHYLNREMFGMTVTGASQVGMRKIYLFN
jgi:hypothetical protein